MEGYRGLENNYDDEKNIMNENLSTTLRVSKEEADFRLDKLLAAIFPDRSRNKWQKLIRSGNVKVDEGERKPSYTVSTGEKISVRVPADFDSDRLVPQDLSLDIVHEDPTLIGVNKPDGMVVHPGPGHEKGTLANGLIHRYDRLPKLPDPTRPGIVHRLDKDTSGVLAVARTEAGYLDLKEQFKKRETEKVYLAVVEGHFDEEGGMINAPVGRSSKDKTKMTVKLGGKDSRTEFSILEELDNASLLRVKPLTGRTHQIRVHMSYIGHKILGDSYYGGPQHERLMLHSKRLTLRHPENGDIISLEAPEPEEFREMRKN